MVTLNVAVYSISTGLPIPNATITIDATPQPSVGIALYGTKRLVRITDANGQVLIDSTAFGFLVYDDGMYWSWSAAAAANGYVTSSSATSSTPGNNTYIVIKLPTAATTAPAPTITSTMAPTSGGIIIPAIPNPLTDAITQTDTAVNKTISTVSKTLIIGAIVLIGVIAIAIYLTTPRSPAPAADLPGQSSDKVQVRRVRVGQAGFDPATRSVGARDVEVTAR